MTSYTATITTGARDLAGNPLATSMAWSFTTASAIVAVPPSSLGGLGTFEILAGSTVTSTGAITGFPPAILNGTLHIADPTAALAQLALTTAYNDAAGRSVGAIMVAGNLGGLTLAPGVYKSTSSLEISSGD